MRQNLIYISSAMLAALSLAACQSTATSDASKAAEAAASAKPVEEIRELTIPAGTTLSAALDDSVASSTSRVDEPVRAHLTRPVSVDGVIALPEGTSLTGAVVDAQRSERVKGRARVAIRFDSLRPAEGGETYTIRAAEISRTAQGQVKKDAVKVGVGAGIGAAVGALVGGGKGAAIGSGVGAGGGTAYVMSERGPEVGLGRGAAVLVKLLEPIRVRQR